MTRVLPDGPRRRTGPAFERIGLFNERILPIYGSGLWPQLRLLHQALTQTTSDYLPLVILGSQALEQAVAQQFDLLMLDIALPGADGLSVLAQLRAQGISTPVMMLTANADQDRGLFTSAAGFVTDPMQPDLYMNDVKSAMSASLNDERAKALGVSLAAATALAHSQTTLFDLTGAVDALADTLAEKPDNIRLAALAALARFGTPAGEERVLALHRMGHRGPLWDLLLQNGRR